MWIRYSVMKIWSFARYFILYMPRTFPRCYVSYYFLAFASCLGFVFLFPLMVVPYCSARNCSTDAAVFCSSTCNRLCVTRTQIQTTDAFCVLVSRCELPGGADMDPRRWPVDARGPLDPCRNPVHQRRAEGGRGSLHLSRHRRFGRRAVPSRRHAPCDG